MTKTAREYHEDLLTVKEAAEYKGVHRGTVYKALREGRLSPFRRKKPYLIHRGVLDAWVPQPRSPGPHLIR